LDRCVESYSYLNATPTRVTVKIGYFGYDEVLPKLRAELDRLIAERSAAAAAN